MIHQSPDKSVAKGWFAGPWNSAVPVPVGYANAGINEPHHHAQMFEIYLVACGTSTAVVNQQLIKLQAGDMLVVEPGETHTFSHSSDDYFHFVIQTPFVPGDKIQEDDKK
jgi:quercetin dioxygenase-like cupin family protein